MEIQIDPSLIKDIALKGKRVDGRAFDAYRDVKIEPNIISSAEGSCRVTLGNTQVICGIKMAVGTPYADTPDEGVLTVGAELVPLASPEFEAGRPGEQAIELARVVDRAIRESKTVDFKALSIKAEKAVWMVYVDIDVLNDDGNLIDSAGIAAATALATARMPALIEEGDKFEADYEKKEKPLPMKGIPISTTFVKIGSAIMADPGLNEYEALDARLTVGTIEKDGKLVLASMQKGGPLGLTVEEVEQIIDLAQKKSQEIRDKIKALV